MQTASTSATTKPSLRHILVAVSVCLMACGTMGLPNAYGVFYKPMSEALATGQGAITLHMSICNLVVGLFTPVVSRSLSRGHLIRNIMLLASVFIIVSGVVIAYAPNTLVMDIAAVVRGMGLAAVSMLIITLYIGNWFVKGRGTLTGLALSGSGIGSALASPVIASCIGRFGYQTTYLGFVICTVACILPVALLCPLTPQEVGLRPYGEDETSETAAKSAQANLDLKFTVASPVFCVLVVLVLCIVLITALSGHMATLAQSYGFSAQLGALLLSAAMIGNVTSKFALGAIADRLGAFRAIVCSLVATLAGLTLILLNVGGELVLLASGFLYGAAFSIGSLGISLLTRYLYGDDQYARAYSVISLVISFASALGITIIGFAYDITGSYAAPIICGISLAVIAGACLAFIGTSTRK